MIAHHRHCESKSVQINKRKESGQKNLAFVFGYFVLYTLYLPTRAVAITKQRLQGNGTQLFFYCLSVISFLYYAKGQTHRNIDLLATSDWHWQIYGSLHWKEPEWISCTFWKWCPAFETLYNLHILQFFYHNPNLQSTALVYQVLSHPLQRYASREPIWHAWMTSSSKV